MPSHRKKLTREREVEVATGLIVRTARVFVAWMRAGHDWRRAITVIDALSLGVGAMDDRRPEERKYLRVAAAERLREARQELGRRRKSAAAPAPSGARGETP